MKFRANDHHSLKTTLSLVIRTKAGEKLAGIVNYPIDLRTEPERNVQLRWEHCPDQEAKVKFRHEVLSLQETMHS